MVSQLRYKRRSLPLFFVVAFVPALTVGAIWYAYSRGGNSALYVNLQSFIIPAMFAGILPALLLSFAFAELLARPFRQIHAALDDLVAKRFKLHLPHNRRGEFGEINHQLHMLASTLEQAFSQAASETAVIAAERNKLRGVLDSMTDGVLALDHDQRIMLFNRAAAEITGHDLASVAGQPAAKVLPVRAGNELVLEGDNLELERADGSVIKVNARAIRIDSDPNGIRALVTLHDVTKQQELEAMKVDFVALAAHELRTPLTEIRGYLDVIRHDTDSLDGDTIRLIDRALGFSQHLAGLINNLLNVARIEHGELTFNPQPVDWLTTLSELEPILAARARAAKIKLELKLPSRLAQIYVDPVSITEVIDNLMSNAITHTPANGRITISVERLGDEVSTVVTDTGCGIPASAQPRLFTKFYRVEGLQTSHGTGLGLYIAKSIIEAHHGRIWVDSTEGQGSTFGFTLPLAKLAASSAKPHNKRITKGTHGWIQDHSVR